MSGEDKREAVFVKVTDSLSEAQNLMSQAQQLMQAEAEKLAQERKEFEEIRKKLDHVHFGKTVKLNVGGKIFKTSLETLCKDPNSMLAAMFSGRFELKQDEDGAYFIDRDGKLFRFILDYLRKGKLDLSDGKLALISKPLSSEASFFQLRSLEEFLSTNRVVAFRNSSIITDFKQEETLLSFLKGSACDTENWCLLYKATRDGWQAKEFHARCDGKSPTLVVVKGASNVLGGYATEAWHSDPKLLYKHSQNAFLFFLENSAGKPPMKFKAFFGGGIKFSGSRGPSFGSTNSMDFTTMHMTKDSNVLSFEGGQAYVSSSGQSLKNHTGLDSLLMDEMEVFCPK